jgi:uncharacterized protein (TIGR03118 family)
LPGSFTDSRIPKGFAPFNIQELNDQLYVTYAKQDATGEDDVAGKGNGFVDVFDTNGRLARRLIGRHELNSPWGLVIAPKSFGKLGGMLLVGNFGDGRIHAYDPKSGKPRGELHLDHGGPVRIDGLWALRFGNGTIGDANTLLFSAGPDDESHGLVGAITVAGKH